MEKITKVKHWYLSTANLNHMRWLGSVIAACGLLLILVATYTPGWTQVGLYGWLASLAGLILFWGGTYEAIVERKASPGDHLILWVVGLTVVIGVPLLLVAVLIAAG
ncbi:hypothetical protein [Aestuariispira ectoiniformans]|uniref:hypothetical protein n=1 Tax=Aestuariispira ectoiniformans TaxID=2775080 RepID=UPI00223BFC29|nr:hypothetical protein [Aestuariispira ectoiniformans]